MSDGLTSNNATDAIQKLEHQYETITIVAGGNDCSQDGTPESAVNSFQASINAVKDKSQRVLVSIICPHPTSEAVQEKIDLVNVGLPDACREDESVTFTDVLILSAWSA